MKNLTRAVRAVLPLLGGLLVLALWVQPATAQIGNQNGALERELEQTEEIIRQAADLARDAGHKQAGELVKMAVQIQVKARSAFGHGRFDEAGVRTRAAREIAQRAMGLLLRPEERVERVELELERTDEMVGNVRAAGDREVPESARAMVQVALNQQEQAWHLYRAARLRPALRMTLQVRELLRKAQGEMSGFGPARLEMLFEETSQQVERAQHLAAETGERRRLEVAERAQNMLARAHRLQGEGSPRAAYRHLVQAGRLAEQVLSQKGPEISQEDYEAAAARYGEEADRLRERLREQRNQRAEQLFDESGEHFGMAQRIAAGEGDQLWRAMAELRIAARLLNRAHGLLE